MFRFETHSFDPDTGELSGPAGVARLQPKPARLLGLLLEADGRLVERETIRGELWPDTTVDFDAGLSTCVRQIRSALSESGGRSEWIETLPKRGYRFTATPSPPRLQTLDGGAGDPAASHPRTVAEYVGIAVIVIAMIAAAVAGWVLAGPPAGEADPQRARLVILPFSDPDGDVGVDFNRALALAFVVAMTNADPETIAVIGPATTGRMLLSGLTPDEIAAELGADFILVGGHREADHSTFVQVLVVPSGEHLFAQRFDIDENQPAHAPAAVITAMTEAIRTAWERGGPERR